MREGCVKLKLSKHRRPYKFNLRYNELTKSHSDDVLIPLFQECKFPPATEMSVRNAAVVNAPKLKGNLENHPFRGGK